MPTSYWVFVTLVGAAFLVDEVRRFDRQHWLWRCERAQSKTKFVVGECAGLVLGTLLTGILLGSSAWFLIVVGGGMALDRVAGLLTD